MGKRAVAGKRTTEQRIRKEMLREVDALEKKVAHEYMDAMRPLAIAEAISQLICVSMIILHDYYGFGKKRLLGFGEHFFNYIDSLQQRYVHTNDIVDEVERLCGVRYGLGEKEVRVLEKYGLDNLVKSVTLMTEQMEYVKKDGQDKRRKATG